MNLININIKYKKKFLRLKIKKNEIDLIKILVKINLIKYIKKSTNTEYVIFLNLENNIPFISIKNLYRPSNVFFLKKQEVTNLINLKKNILILSTSNGIKLITSANACVGGVLIAKVFFN